MAEPLVRDVSDTARWIAAYRAEESARQDALFRDPYAARFADARGVAIGRRVSRPARTSITLRTRLIDDMILASGADRVVNLAAGFDTRPYRLDLPAQLRWIEADLPDLVAEKERLLAGETPRCALTREAVDLADAKARVTFLDQALAGARQALVLTEGLLVYLGEDDVRALAGELRARPQVRDWVFDLLSPAIRRYTQRRVALENAPLRFAPREGVAWFEREGWRAAEIRNTMLESIRLGRAPLSVRLARPLLDVDPRRLGQSFWYGVVRLQPA